MLYALGIILIIIILLLLFPQPSAAFFPFKLNRTFQVVWAVCAVSTVPEI